jgi:hypothetical protein
MNIRNFVVVSFLILFIFPAFAQDGSRFRFSGEITGMYTYGGLADESQVIAVSSNIPPGSDRYPSGIFDDNTNGRNGYFTSVNFNFLYNPFSFIDIYAKFLARSRPGSPYIPLQLESSSADTFNIMLDNAYGRINAIEAFGLTLPIGLYFKAGKFDTTPSSFQRVTNYGAENVISRLRTKNINAFQLEFVYRPDFGESISFTATTNQKLNEAITPLYDSDGTKGYHGEPSLDEKYDIPLHFALKARNINTPIGPVSAELIYAYNAENIFSGHSFGFSAGLIFSIPQLDKIEIPIGIAAAIYEKNIDPFAKVALDTFNTDFFDALHVNDHDTVSFRRSLRTGFAIGLHYRPLNWLQTQLNFGYSWSQVSHIYRDTLTLHSASVDMLVTINNQFFIGGGLYLGTLFETEWKTSAGTDISRENGYSRIFRPNENLGYEIFCGLVFNQGVSTEENARISSRFIVGFNNNRGLAMNNNIESISDAQIKYKQKDTSITDGLFEYGGIFAKLVISW